MRGVAAAFLVAFAALFALPLQAQAQTALISNTGQAREASVVSIASRDKRHSQGFRTGSNVDGYTLTSVGLYVDNASLASGKTFIVHIYTANSSGALDSLVHTLTSPSYTNDAVNLFTAPANAMLAADTDYLVVFEGNDPTASNFQVGITLSDAEDSGAATGWSIEDARRFDGNLSSTGVSFQISVNGSVGGTPPTLSDDATLSDLKLENNSGTGITLSPTFASGTTTYTAMVVNAVDEITIIPTVSESNATYEIQDSGGTALTDADTNTTGFQVALSEGANTIKVEVTAEDDATTETYDVVVTRSMAATPTVSISADKTTAVFKEDGITYTLTRTGSTTDALAVTVTLAQTKSFLATTELTKTVTIAVGQSTNTFTVAASSFQHFALGTTVEGGTLTATVQDGTDYDLGTPSSVDVNIVIGMMVWMDIGSLFVAEAAGTFSFKVIGRTGEGAPQPSSTTGTISVLSGNVTAINNTDFAFQDVNMEFLPADFSADGTRWEAERTFTVSVTNDALDEDDETFNLKVERHAVTSMVYLLVTRSGNACGSINCTQEKTITDDDTAGVTVSKSALTVMEENTTGDTYTVVLDSQPTANVSITIGGQSGTDVTATPSPMTFTPMNWATAQTVTVTAGNDMDTANDTVSLTHSATSTDTDYSGIAITGVTVTVNDNDTANNAPTFPSSTADRSVAENTAAGQNVGAVLTATDSDGDTLTYTLEGTDAASFDLVTTADPAAQIRTKTGVTYNHEVKSTYTVVVKADDGNSGTATVTVTITITDVDNEAPGRPVAPTVTSVTGSNTSLAVSWTAPTNTGPAIDTYDLRYREGTSGPWTSGPQDRTGTGTSIGSLDAGTAYRVQVRATNDEGDSNWSPSGTGTTNAPATPTVSISADETTAVFKEDGITYTLTRSGSTTVALPVTVALTQTKSFLLTAELTKTVTIAVGQSTNTFTVAASSFQHFAAGTMVEGGTLTATVQDGTDYDLGTPASVDVAIVIGVMVRLEGAPLTNEGTASFTFKVIARTGAGAPQPSATTGIISVLTEDISATKNLDFEFVPASWNVQPGNFLADGTRWEAEITYTVSIENDALDEGDETFNLVIERPQDSLAYSLVDASGNSCGTKCTVMRTIADNDTAGVTVSKTSVTVTEEGATDTYTVVLDSQPTADVTISIGGQSGTDVTTNPSPMTFTPVNWETARTVTVTAGDDADLVNDTATLTHSAPVFADTTADRSVDENTAAGQNVGAVLTATDSDGDTLTYTLEGTDAASFDLVTTTDPAAQIQTKAGVTYNHEVTPSYTVVVKADDSNGGTATVTVTITVEDVDGEAPGRPDPPSVSATSGTTDSLDVTWTAPTNTGPDIDNYDLRYKLQGTMGSWTNGPQDVTGTSASISGLDPGTEYAVQVRATSDEGDSEWSTGGRGTTGTPTTTPGVTVLPTTLTVTEQDADGDTYTVVLDTEPTTSVVVTIGGHSGTDVTAAPTPLTFTSTTWSTAQEVTVTAGNDANTADETFTLTHDATSSDSSYSGITIASVTVTVEDNDTGNNPPVFSQGTSTTLSFSGAAGNVGAVTAGDADGDTLTYSLGGPASNKFDIDRNTGQISTVANETYTPGDVYTVTVTADDGEGGTDTIDVTIRVRTVTPPPPANGSPEFGASSAMRSMEETVGDAGAETAVRVGAPVTAADPDGDAIEYSLGGTDGDKFDIDGNTGQILGRAGERYDHEEKQSYEVTVSASDGEGGADTIEVTINIDNVSEAPEAPGALRVRASGMTALGISWSAPRNAGRPEIEGYDLRYRNTVEAEWSDGPSGVEETETEVQGLLEDTEYEVQVRAVNAEGAGEWSQAASGRTGVQPAGVAVAWLGRFGRTVAEHVLSGVSARITALRSSGITAALGGLDLFPVESPDEPEHEDREEFGDWFGEEEEDSFRFLTMAGNDIKTRSSFVLGRSSGGGFGAVWGSGAFGGFNGRESGVSFEGVVRTGMLGADYAVGGLVGGVALSRSVGEGSYRNGRGSGKVKSSVTGIYPYAGNELSEKFSVWAVAGYGRGEMKVTLPGDGESGSADIYMKMAAAGARGDLVSGADEAGIGVSVEMDTLFVRTTSDGGRGIEAVEADVSRVRLSVEGSLGHALGDGGMLRPLIEAGIRRDGGDAETGFGADLGAGLQFSDTSGELSMQIMGRTLVVHEAGGFQDWGVSGSIRYDPYPDSPRGLMISLAHSAGGASDGGADALLGRGTLEGLGDGEAIEWNSRLVGEAGYGFGVLGGVFTGTPYMGFGASEGLRDYYLGLRLARMNRDAFDLEFGVEATREESAGAYDPIHGMTFRLALRR